MTSPLERWPGESGRSAVALPEAARRWSSGNAGLLVATDDGSTLYCFVRRAEADDGRLVLTCTSRALEVAGPRAGAPILDLEAGWEALVPRIRGCTRDISEWGAGLYQAHVVYLCREGWARIDLLGGDPETVASLVLRELAGLGDRPRFSALEAEVGRISPNYDVYLIRAGQRRQIAGAA